MAAFASTHMQPHMFIFSLLDSLCLYSELIVGVHVRVSLQWPCYMLL